LIIDCRAPWQDLDAAEEVLQAGPVRLQAQEALSCGHLPGDQEQRHPSTADWREAGILISEQLCFEAPVRIFKLDE
jgi:hypothetical protein